MINGKRIAAVLPAHNAERTLEVTVSELPELVDIPILVDDGSSDATVALGRFSIFNPQGRMLSGAALTEEMEAAMAKEAQV